MSASTHLAAAGAASRHGLDNPLRIPAWDPPDAGHQYFQPESRPVSSTYTSGFQTPPPSRATVKSYDAPVLTPKPVGPTLGPPTPIGFVWSNCWEPVGQTPWSATRPPGRVWPRRRPALHAAPNPKKNRQLRKIGFVRSNRWEPVGQTPRSATRPPGRVWPRQRPALHAAPNPKKNRQLRKIGFVPSKGFTAPRTAPGPGSRRRLRPPWPS
jgi:hypothetical protein